MSKHDVALDEAAARIAADPEGLLKRWRAQVRRLPAAKKLDTPTLNDHVPPLLDDLIAALMSGRTLSVLDHHLKESPEMHGSQRLRHGFDIGEVVAEYNILRDVILTAVEEE